MNLRFSLKYKFVLLLGVFFLAIASIILLHYNTSKRVTVELHQVHEKDFPRFLSTSQLINRFEEITRLFEDAVLTGEDVLLERAEMDRQTFGRYLNSLKVLPEEPALPLILEIEKNFDDYFMAAQDLAYSLLKDQESDLALMAGQEDKSIRVSELRRRLEEDLGKLLSEANNLVQSSIERSRWEVRLQLRRTLVIGSSAFVFFLLFLWYLSRQITIPIGALSRMTAEVAKGNFDAKEQISFLGNDEVGELARSFDTMKKGLRESTVSRAYLDNIIHSMADALIVLDTEFRITTVNTATLKLLEYEREELMGRSIDILFLGASFRDWSKSEMLFQRTVVRERERVLVAKSGKRIPVIFSASLLEHDKSSRPDIVCVAQDITDLKSIEAELANRAEELARSNADLEQFAYVASHDLQEPLRMVVSYLQLIKRRYQDKLDSDAEEFIHFAVDGGIRMKGLINDLLAYSRVGTSQEAREEVDCTEVLKEILLILDRSIKESGTSVTYDPLPRVYVVESQLSQLLQNLISNAIKYRSTAPLNIHIGAERKDDNWLFCVRDNGIGIEKQYLERIFVIFQRLHTREEYSGTGIGLAICKKIVEKHHGRIWAESKHGEGSAFYFTLPTGHKK